MAKYDIFISYRHSDTADKAEHLLSLLESHGYKGQVSFDRDNLDERFDLEILKRLDRCKDFIIILGFGTLSSLSFEDTQWYQKLASCDINEFAEIENEFITFKLENAKVSGKSLNEYDKHLDYVRLEIARAISKGKHIIPIVPVNSDNYNFDNLVLPSDIRLLIKQQAERYQDSKDFLFKDILPRITKRLKTFSIKRKFLILLCSLILFLLCLISYATYNYIQLMELSSLKTEIETKYNKFGIKISDDATVDQVQTIDDIFGNMIEVIPDSLWISRYECKVCDWNGITNEPYDVRDGEYPKININLAECEQIFLAQLRELTNISEESLCLPDVEDWQFAAKGGLYPDSTIYSGDNDVNKVACYKGNSKGSPHKCDGQTTYANNIGLYDMSGNVSEWVLNDFTQMPKMAICGGDFLSEAKDVTVNSVKYVNPNSKKKNIGFRIIYRKTK